MIKFKVANDLHIGSKYQDNPNAEKELLFLENDGKTVLLGDIFDRACCKKKDLPKLTDRMNHFIKEFGEFYVMGNHERNGTSYDPLILTVEPGKRVGFAHGDLIADKAKWTWYRRRAPGASMIGLLISYFFDDLDFLKSIKPLPKDFISNALKYCESYALDVLVVAHFHLRKEKRYTFNDKIIIILPAHKINEVVI